MGLTVSVGDGVLGLGLLALSVGVGLTVVLGLADGLDDELGVELGVGLGIELLCGLGRTDEPRLGEVPSEGDTCRCGPVVAGDDLWDGRGRTPWSGLGTADSTGGPAGITRGAAGRVADAVGLESGPVVTRCVGAAVGGGPTNLPTAYATTGTATNSAATARTFQTVGMGLSSPQVSG